MSKFYKSIKRLNTENNKKETFIASGQLAEGHLIYTKIINGIRNYDKMYIQIREDNQLKMILFTIN